jgi:urea transporter
MLFTRQLMHRSTLRGWSSKNIVARFLGSSPGPDAKKEDESAAPVAAPEPPKNVLVRFGDATARGVGQVIFLNSPTSGAAILGSLALGDPYLAGLAAVGTVAATGAAQVLDKDALKDGLYGYNGCLVGCATAVFIAPSAVLSGLVTTVVAGAASPFVAAALKPAMGSVPQWTLSFNFVTLTMLMRLKPFAEAAPLPAYEGSIANLCMSSPLKGVSQIFVVDSNMTGAALLGSMAMYSPGLAAHTVMGSAVGALTGYSLGADTSELAMGLWGFNSALTSLGCGVFFVHSPAAMAVSVGGAAATAALFGAMKTIFGSCFAAPCLTLPFCIAMSGCYFLPTAMTSLGYAKSPHSPEKNE